jgi:hypothetical protein
MVMKRWAGALFAVVVPICMVALGACSGASTGEPATAASLATKLKDASVCKTIRPSRNTFVRRGWVCHTDALSDPQVWAFASQRQATEARVRLTRKTCAYSNEKVQQMASQFHVNAPPVAGKVILVYAVGRKWFAAFDNDGGPEPWQAAKVLHGHVLEHEECPAQTRPTAPATA